MPAAPAFALWLRQEDASPRASALRVTQEGAGLEELKQRFVGLEETNIVSVPGTVAVPLASLKIPEALAKALQLPNIQIQIVEEILRRYPQAVVAVAGSALLAPDVMTDLDMVIYVDDEQLAPLEWESAAVVEEIARHLRKRYATKELTVAYQPQGQMLLGGKRTLPLDLVVMPISAVKGTPIADQGAFYGGFNPLLPHFARRDNRAMDRFLREIAGIREEDLVDRLLAWDQSLMWEAKKLVRSDPGNPKIRARLAMIAYSMGDTGLARELRSGKARSEDAFKGLDSKLFRRDKLRGIFRERLRDLRAGLEEPGGTVDPMAWWQRVPARLDRWQAIAATFGSARNGQQLQRDFGELQEVVLRWNAQNSSPGEYHRTLGVALIVARAAAGAEPPIPVELRVPLVSAVLVAGIIPRWPRRPDPKIQPILQHLQKVIETGGIKEAALAYALINHWLPFVRPGRRGPDVDLKALPAVDRKWIRQHQKDLLLANKLLWAADRLGPYLLPSRSAADHFNLWQRNLPYLSALHARESVETLLASLDQVDPVHRLIWDKSWEALVTQFLKELPQLSQLGRAWILDKWWMPTIQQGVADRVDSVLRRPKGSSGDGQLRRLSSRVLTPLQKERLRGGTIPQLILLDHDGQAYLLQGLAEFNRGTRRWLLAPLTAGESVIRIKSPKELIQGFVFLIDSLKVAHAGLEEAVEQKFTYGPVSPGEELRKRRDNFRSAFIAVISGGHRSSSTFSLDGLLSEIYWDLRHLSDSEGINAGFMRKKVTLISEISDVNKGIYKEAFKQFLQRFSASEELQGRPSDLLSLLKTLSEDLSGFGGEIEALRADDAQMKTQQIIHRIKENVIQARDWVMDRLALARGESPEGATSSFSEIKESFLSKYEHSPLTIESTPEAETARVSMTSARLFSLLSNPIANALGHLPPNAVGRVDAEGKVILHLQADPVSQELVVRVEDNGTGIDSGYFEETPQGMPRLFSLEEGDWHIRIGMPEVWDIVAIAGGRLAVESRHTNKFPDNHGTTFTVWLPLSDAGPLTPPGAWLPIVSAAGLEESQLNRGILEALRLLGTRDDKRALLGGGGESGRAAIQVFQVLEEWVTTPEAILSSDRLADAVEILKQADKIWGLREAQGFLLLLVNRKQQGAHQEEIRRLFLQAVNHFSYDHNGQAPSQYLEAEWGLAGAPLSLDAQMDEVRGFVEMELPERAIVKIMEILEDVSQDAAVPFGRWQEIHRLLIEADLRLRWDVADEQGHPSDEEDLSGGGLQLADRPASAGDVEAQELPARLWRPVLAALARFKEGKASEQNVRHFLERYLTGHRNHYGENLSETLRREWNLGRGTGLEEIDARARALERVRAVGKELRDGDFGKALREMDHRIGKFLSQPSPDFEKAPVEGWIGLVRQAEGHSESVIRRLDQPDDYVGESIALTLMDELRNDLSSLSTMLRAGSSAERFNRARDDIRFILGIVDELAGFDGWREWYIAKKPDSALRHDLHGLLLKTTSQGSTRASYQDWVRLDDVIRGLLPKVEQAGSVQTGWIVSFEAAKRTGADLLIAALAQKGRKLPIAFIAETDFRKESLMLTGVPEEQIKKDPESAFGWLVLSHQSESAILVFDKDHGKPVIKEDLSSHLFPIELHTFVEMLDRWLDLAGIGVEAQAAEKLKGAITAYAA